MKKLLLFVSALALTLTGCEDNDSPDTVLTSDITVNNVGFKPSRNGATTFFSEGTGDSEDRRQFSLVKSSGANVTQGIYITLQLREGRTNEGGSYIFHIGETATNLFANGFYTEGEKSYGIAGGTVHVTEMTDGYFKLVFDDVEARDVFNQSEPKLISGEYKAKFKVVEPAIE
ncbi:hypothetical protein [uncultured Flavobacterium sp.]|uniref:hypothetical protein n=1 Tax=uncultured Flavobacterium sp. TaxID=165435 RepID=UPI0025DC3B5F|nr:hypothetical protein [uncultured Flavobacterium sp.]